MFNEEQQQQTSNLNLGFLKHLANADYERKEKKYKINDSR